MTSTKPNIKKLDTSFSRFAGWCVQLHKRAAAPLECGGFLIAVIGLATEFIALIMINLL